MMEEEPHNIENVMPMRSDRVCAKLCICLVLNVSPCITGIRLKVLIIGVGVFRFVVVGDLGFCVARAHV
jgi:hypothetical protein